MSFKQGWLMPANWRQSCRACLCSLGACVACQGRAYQLLPVQHCTSCGSQLLCFAGVLSEIVDRQTGQMARTPQLLEFARVHGLKCITVTDLVRYLNANDIRLSS